MSLSCAPSGASLLPSTLSLHPTSPGDTVDVASKDTRTAEKGELDRNNRSLEDGRLEYFHVSITKMGTGATASVDWTEKKVAKETSDLRMTFKRKLSMEKDSSTNSSFSQLCPPAPRFHFRSLDSPPRASRIGPRTVSYHRTDIPLSSNPSKRVALVRVLPTNHNRFTAADDNESYIDEPSKTASPAEIATQLPQNIGDGSVGNKLGTSYSATEEQLSFQSPSLSQPPSLLPPLFLDNPSSPPLNISQTVTDVGQNGLPADPDAMSAGYSQGEGRPFKKQIFLDPSASSFIPGLFLIPQDCPATPRMNQGATCNLLPTFSTFSHASQRSPQPMLSSLKKCNILHSEVPSFAGEGFKNPDISPFPSISPVLPPRNSDRHCLPDPSTPPPTPTPKFSAQFGNLLPPRKIKFQFSQPLRLPLAQSPKRPNPFIDFSKTGGNDPAATFYEMYPAMEAYRNFRAKIDPKTLSVGPFRKAALWEITGHTFDKGTRKGHGGQKKRHRAYVARSKDLGRRSGLANEILIVEEGDDISSMEEAWRLITEDA